MVVANTGNLYVVDSAEKEIIGKYPNKNKIFVDVAMFVLKVFL